MLSQARVAVTARRLGMVLRVARKAEWGTHLDETGRWVDTDRPRASSVYPRWTRLVRFVPTTSSVGMTNTRIATRHDALSRQARGKGPLQVQQSQSDGG
jgi:hypothetical protein